MSQLLVAKSVTVATARRRYTNEFKLKLVLYYESLQVDSADGEKSLSYIQRISGIDRRVFVKWVHNKDCYRLCY